MASAQPQQSPTPRAPGHDALVEVLKKLRETLASMRSGLGSGMGNAGGTGVGTWGAGAMASLQGIAGSVKQTLDQTATAFASSMASTQRAWKAGLVGGQAAWTASVDAFRTHFGAASSSVAARFEKAFDATVGRGIDLMDRGFIATARAAQKVWTNPVGAVGDPIRAAWGFGSDFVSNWRHATPGGVPVGGLGAAWGTATGLGWQALTRGAATTFRSTHRRFARAVAGMRRGFGRRARYSWIRAGRAYARSRSVGVAARAGAAAFAGRGLAGLAAGAIPIVGQVVTAYNAFNAMVMHMKGEAERFAGENRHWSRYNGSLASEYQRADMGDLRRSFSYARQTSGSSINLVRAVDQMRDDWQGYHVFEGEVKNRVGGFFAGFAGQMGKDWSAGVAPITAKIQQVDPNGLVSTGAGSGFAAAINSLPGEVKKAAFDDPLLALLTLGAVPIYRGIYNAGQVGANVATNKVNGLATPPQNDNLLGRAMHQLAKPGPNLRRPTPIFP